MEDINIYLGDFPNNMLHVRREYAALSKNISSDMDT